MNWHNGDGCHMEWMVVPPAPEGPPHSPIYDGAIPIHILVTPCLPSHAVILEYRVKGGPTLSVPALPFPADPNITTRRFQAVLPAKILGEAEYLPILLCNGKPVSPRLEESPSSISLFHPQLPLLATDSRQKQNQAGFSSGVAQPRWDWSSNFLGSLTARLRKELVGPTPDGLRINWHVVEGSFVGPGIEARICSGATDWMRILENGIGVVDVKATFKTTHGSLIYGTYGGVFDLGPEGYQNMLEGRADPLPPVVVTPTYATAAAELAWLNRLQCVGVGRVDMQALEVSFDVYRITVGDRLPGQGCLKI